ncbi:MAG TPA: hypothetical protein VMW43_02985 [Bacteroidota bacterium]|nr:hypothetical protein [Bacteroidota bacterium]
MKRICTAVLILLAVAGTGRAYAQGLYTPAGTCGFGLTADGMTQNGTTGTGATAGYSICGVADIRCSADHFWIGDKLGGQNVTANLITPSLTLYGTGGSPISAYIRVGYAIARYSSAALDTLHGTLNGNSVSILTAVYTRVGLSPSISIYPAFGLQYIEGNHNDDIGFNPSVSTSFSRTPFILNMPISFSLDSGTMFVIEPGLRVFPQLATEPSFTELSLSAGFVLPTRFPF